MHFVVVLYVWQPHSTINDRYVLNFGPLYCLCCLVKVIQFPFLQLGISVDNVLQVIRLGNFS